MIGKTVEKGLTLVPTRLYFKNGRVKVAIALARGKQVHDKRETIRRREIERETRALVKERAAMSDADLVQPPGGDRATSCDYMRQAHRAGHIFRRRPVHARAVTRCSSRSPARARRC